MKTLILSLASSLFLMIPTISKAQVSPAKTNIVDKFECTIQVDKFKNEPGYTAKMKLSAVREQWNNQGTNVEAPANDIEANIQSKSGLEVQLHYDYAFKNAGAGWSLYRCFAGYTKYKGQETRWACPQHSFAVPNINGVPQFDQFGKFDQEILVGDNAVGNYTCNLIETVVTP